MIETKKFREFYDGVTVSYHVKADILGMCDEIDRLRDQLAEQEFAAQKLEMEIALLKVDRHKTQRP